jgi:hypothetical protein
MDTRVKPAYDERIFFRHLVCLELRRCYRRGSEVPDILQRASKTEPPHNTAFPGRRNATAIRNAMIEEMSQNRA